VTRLLRLLEWPARYFVAGVLILVGLYFIALLVVAFAAALTMPIWIWWCV